MISASSASNVVIVAYVPTKDVTNPVVILTSLRSAVSVSKVVIVAAVPTISVTIPAVILAA